MEIITYDYNAQQSREFVARVDYKKLIQDIDRRPEDYIFLLTPIEYSKYQELNEQLMMGLQGEPMKIDEEAYSQRYPDVFSIVYVAIQPQFAKKYKVGDMTNDLVGNNHIVFYINRRDQGIERAQQVLRRIAELKNEVLRHPEQ